MQAANTYEAYLRRETMRVVVPYLVVGMVALLWAFMISRTRFPAIAREHENEAEDHGSFRELLRYPNFLFAIVAQFLYVGAQVGTWSYFIQYVQDGTHEPEKIAGYFLTGTLVAFGVGRFSSAALMRYVKPAYLMGVYSLVNIGLVAVGVAFPGWVGLWAIFTTSFFMSVMFPTIFALGHRRPGSEHEDRRIAYRDGDRWGRRAHTAHGLDFTNTAQYRESVHGPIFLLLRDRSLLVYWGPHEATERPRREKEKIYDRYKQGMLSLAASLLMMTGLVAVAQQPAPDWQTRLAHIMPLLGHRNWIMIVDSAYPLQSSAGVETLETNADQLEVIRTVLGAIDSSIQVRPIVYMDAELPFVTEKDAPGVTAYREGAEGRPWRTGDHVTATRANHRQGRRGGQDISHRSSKNNHDGSLYFCLSAAEL